MDNFPSVFAVVVTFNGIKWLDKCLSSLKGSNYPVHIVIVDNCSSDGSAEYIQNEFPYTYLIRNAENQGFGRANNIGIRYALEHGADYLLLLNQDAFIEADTISLLVKSFENNEDAGIVSPVHMNGTGTGLDRYFKAYLEQYGAEKDINTVLSLQKKDQDINVGFINAAAWLVSRKCVEKVGGFNPIFPHYGEDNDYVSRLFYHHFKLLVKCNALVYHDREARDEIVSLKRLKKREYVSFLKRFSVQNSTIRCFFELVDKLFRESIFYLFKLKLKKMAAVVLAFWTCVWQIPEIIKNRRNSRREGAYL